MQDFPTCLAILFILLLQAVPVITNTAGSNTLSGYDCDTEYISDAEVKTALRHYLLRPMKWVLQPARYKGTLYKSDQGLLVVPIINHVKETFTAGFYHESYHIVYQPPENVIAVFFLNSNAIQTHCYRLYDISPATLPVDLDRPLRPQRYNKAKESLLLFYNSVIGFQCGNFFINKVPVLHSHEYVLNVIKNSHIEFVLFPTSIDGMTGPFYIWPLPQDLNLYSMEDRSKTESCYIVTDHQLNFARLFYKVNDDNYQPCSEVPISNLETSNQISTTTDGKELKRGFICDKFFDDEYLHKSREKAKQGRRSYYPKILGETGLYIWPLRPDLETSGKGKPAGYFLVLTQIFKIVSVIMMRENTVMQCKAHTINLDREKINDNFMCVGDKVTNESLTKAVANAFSKQPKKTDYPKLYNGPNFDVPGPYLVMPLPDYKSIERAHRAVFTSDSFLVGVITLRDYRLIKCKREGVEIIGEISNERIYEIPRFMIRLRKSHRDREHGIKRQKLNS